MNQRNLVFGLGLILIANAVYAQGISLGNWDDFESETTAGWRHDEGSPNPPIVVPIGGEGGPEDAYLENFSSGDGGPGGTHVIFNADNRWTGDYIAGGVNKLSVNIINFLSEPLQMRVGLIDSGGNCWATDPAVAIQPFSTWSNYEFTLDESTMVPAGAADFESVARDVAQVRIFSALTLGNGQTGCGGDAVLAVSGYDDIRSYADTDFDGIRDTVDNCTLVPNPRICIGSPAIDNQADCLSGGNSWGQIDSDRDGYGNPCDGDINDSPFFGGDCTVNLLDLLAFRTSFLAQEGDASYIQAADFSYDGIVNLVDLLQFRQLFLGEVGPGLGNCNCKPDNVDSGPDFGENQIFVRGGLNLDWGAVVGINNGAYLGNRQYQSRIMANAGTFGFKIADEDWIISYSSPEATVVVNGQAVNLGLELDPTPQTMVTIPESGCYEFNITANDVAGSPAVAGSVDVRVVGPLP